MSLIEVEVDIRTSIEILMVIDMEVFYTEDLHMKIGCMGVFHMDVCPMEDRHMEVNQIKIDH